jgi:sulfatase maturation enzyme AslB (radical SAM superfamily)
MDSTSWNDWSEVEEHYKKEDNYLVQKIIDLNLQKKPFLDSFVDTDNWWDSFEKLLPYFRRVEFAGGEPLMDPTHYKILDMLAPYGKDIEIKYATNLTILGKSNRTIWQYWPKFKSVAVNVSIDGIGDSYEYVRGNASWSEVINNIKQVQTIPNVSRIVGAVAVQVSNVLILDKMIELFLNDLGIVFYTNMVQYPNVLSAQVIPNELKSLAVIKLKAVRELVPTFKLVKEHPMLEALTYKQIDGIINFILANDNTHLWHDCIEYNRRLDVTREQSFFDVTPEFKPYA